MVYIPLEWLKDKENSNKVHEILNKLDHDVIDIDDKYIKDDAINKLEEIGEDTIIQKLNSGFFCFGAGLS